MRYKDPIRNFKSNFLILEGLGLLLGELFCTCTLLRRKKNSLPHSLLDNNYVSPFPDIAQKIPRNGTPDWYSFETFSPANAKMMMLHIDAELE